MPVTSAYRPDPRFPDLGPGYADAVRPADFPAALPRWFNARWAARIGLDALNDAEKEGFFARFRPLPENLPEPLALRYHGHQFRVYNPDIGDGRGFLYAQLRDDLDRLLDLATKGSGRTPYSRSGDGRLTLKGGVREILAASMLEAQGVYTSKAFALFETGESLHRGDEPSPTRASVLTRLGHSHIRFGTFQRLAFLGESEKIAPLLDHCAQHYHPHLAGLTGDALAGGFLQAVGRASARLAASWMAAGFVHGVLNTDNLTITGESFDYGPWRFLPRSDPAFTAAYFDETGLYAFGRQPESVGWALAQLAGALSTIAPAEVLHPALQAFGPAYSAALIEAVHRRLGIAPVGVESLDLAFLQALFGWMGASGVGWAQVFHDWFGGEASVARAKVSPAAALYADPAFAPIEEQLRAREPVRPERLAHPYFARATPVDLVIETVEAIWAPIAERDDWSLLEATLADIEALREALDLRPEETRLAAQP